MTPISPEPPVRVALLSCAHPHVAAYAAAIQARAGAARVAAVWDDAPAGSPAAVRAAAIAAATGAPLLADLDAALALGADAAVVASENARHRWLVEAAARAGIQAVLCEKPLAATRADAEAMIAACSAAGTRLVNALPCRFSPVLARLQAALDAGRLGRLIAVRATNRGQCPFQWFTDPALSGGGAIIDHTVHVADLIGLLLGGAAGTAVWAEAVCAEASSGIYHQPEWEDCALLTVDYPGGVFATLDASWSRPLKSFPTWGDVTLELVGSEGTASADLFGQASRLYSEEAGKLLLSPWGSDIDALMIDAFLRLARTGEYGRLATGQDGLRALAVAEAAYESARTGRRALVAR